MNRRQFFGATAGGMFAVATPLAAAAAASTDLSIGSLRLRIIQPMRPSKGGVLLIPTIAGLGRFVTQCAGDIAGVGLTAVVWDPYAGESYETKGTLEQLDRSKALKDDGVMTDLSHAVDYMTDALGLRSIGTIGWCMGGRYAILLGGRERRLKAVSAHHPTIYPTAKTLIAGAMLSKADFPGQTLDEFSAAAMIASPAQVIRPGHDLCQPAEYERLRQGLANRPQPTLFDFYPEADHGYGYALDKPANAFANNMAWPSSLAFLKSALLA